MLVESPEQTIFQQEQSASFIEHSPDLVNFRKLAWRNLRVVLALLNMQTGNFKLMVIIQQAVNSASWEGRYFLLHSHLHLKEPKANDQ